MSPIRAKLIPTPAAAPLTAVTNGIGNSRRRRRNGWYIVSSTDPASPDPRDSSERGCRFAPAQKPRPAPVISTHRTPFFGSSTWSKAAINPPSISGDTAFMTSGWLRVRMPTLWSISSLTRSNSIAMFLPVRSAARHAWDAGVGRQASIGNDASAVDIGCLVGSEKKNHVGDFDRLAIPPHRDCGLGVSGKIGQGLTRLQDRRGENRSRTNGIAANSLSRIFDGGCSREIDYPGLDRVVRAKTVVTRQPRNRAGIDDRAFALAHHHLERASRRIPIGSQSDFDGLAPVVQRHLSNPAGVQPDGVVVQDIEAAEFIDREPDHRLDFGGIADVCANRFGDKSASANFARNPLRAFLVQIDDHNRGALFSEPLCRRLADTRARAGDQRNLVLESHVIGSSCDRF